VSLSHALPQAEASPSVKPPKVEWPPAVREYVGRAFEEQNAIKGISREDMTKKLKDVIGYFAERSQLDSLDWANHPLPQELLKEERASARLQSSHDAPISSLNGLANMHFDTPQSKKRKSQDGDLPLHVADSAIPPWRRTNLESRMTFTGGPTEKRHKKNAISADETFSKSDQADLDKREKRFQYSKPSSKAAQPRSATRLGNDSDMSAAPCVGTNQNLEKSYFRLTAPPDPESVRPQHVLEKTLSMLTKKWRDEKKYGYICNQFKSLRQDLTVQHIKNAFTVKVYEIHARIALETGDLGEYNQCQTQLKALYSQKLGGNPAEFTAYRILYFVYTCNKTDMNDLLAELTPADKTQSWIKHALDVRSSLALGNYHKFFKLYLAAENMGSYLMDMFIERERLHALANMSRGYAEHPSLRGLR
jgi:hypothetical protein